MTVADIRSLQTYFGLNRCDGIVGMGEFGGKSSRGMVEEAMTEYEAQLPAARAKIVRLKGASIS
jgi:hypothetical protein